MDWGIKTLQGSVSPTSAIAFASSQKNTSLLLSNSSNSVQSKHAAKADTYQGSEEENDQDTNISSFLPWGKSPIQFGIDVFLSALTYAATYWFINRFSILHLKKFNATIRENLPSEAKKAEFDQVINKLVKYDPLNSNKYWKEFYEPTLLKGGSAHESLSKRDKLFAKFYSIIYAAPRRYVFAGIVSSLSVGRAYATNPDMPLWMGGILFLFPLLTNIFFGRADLDYRKAAQGAALSGLSNEAIKETATMIARSKMDFAELFNFGGKVFAKSIKRADNIVTFVVAIISSMISRISRDVLEGGLPEKELKPYKEDRNPFMRWVARIPFVENLRKLDKKDKGPLRDGFLKNLNIEEKENPTNYMIKGVAQKVGLKYLTDFVVFGLMGMGLLKIVYFFQNLFSSDRKSNQLIYTDTQLIDSLISSPIGGTNNAQNNIVSFNRLPANSGDYYDNSNKGLTLAPTS